jgi:hypothetical protein
MESAEKNSALSVICKTLLFDKAELQERKNTDET